MTAWSVVYAPYRGPRVVMHEALSLRDAEETLKEFAEILGNSLGMSVERRTVRAKTLSQPDPSWVRQWAGVA